MTRGAALFRILFIAVPAEEVKTGQRQLTQPFEEMKPPWVRRRRRRNGSLALVHRLPRIVAHEDLL